MKKTYVVLGIIALILLASCGKQEVDDYSLNSSNSDVVISESISQKLSELNASKTEEISENKFNMVMDEVHEMANNGMDKVYEIYPDLKLVKTIKADNEYNLTGKGDEDWLYSAEYDTTVIVCNNMNTPAHVFVGSDLSSDQIVEVKEMSKEMMLMMMDEEEITVTAGVYADYDPSLVGKTKNTVLFFHADWCATCVKLEANILSGKIPADLTILNANFDRETELKKKYGVLTQTTLVQIDVDGNEIKKWLGGDLDDIIDKTR